MTEYGEPVLDVVFRPEYDDYEWTLTIPGWGDARGVAATEGAATATANEWLARFNESLTTNTQV